MNLCDDGHDEVCYESRNCPACEAVKDKDKEILDLTNKVDELEEQLAEVKQ